MIEKCYISGPITGIPDLNWSAFSESQVTLACLGYHPVNPHEVCALLPRTSKWSDYMRECIAALCYCQSIYMLPGWWKSNGARIEWFISKILGIKRIDIPRTTCDD